MGSSMAAERESHARVSQPHSAEHPHHANLRRSVVSPPKHHCPPESLELLTHNKVLEYHAFVRKKEATYSISP